MLVQAEYFHNLADLQELNLNLNLSFLSMKLASQIALAAHLPRANARSSFHSWVCSPTSSMAEATQFDDDDEAVLFDQVIARLEPMPGVAGEGCNLYVGPAGERREHVLGRDPASEVADASTHMLAAALVGCDSTVHSAHLRLACELAPSSRELRVFATVLPGKRSVQLLPPPVPGAPTTGAAITAGLQVDVPVRPGSRLRLSPKCEYQLVSLVRAAAAPMFSSNTVAGSTQLPAECDGDSGNEIVHATMQFDPAAANDAVTVPASPGRGGSGSGKHDFAATVRPAVSARLTSPVLDDEEEEEEEEEERNNAAVTDADVVVAPSQLPPAALRDVAATGAAVNDDVTSDARAAVAPTPAREPATTETAWTQPATAAAPTSAPHVPLRAAPDLHAPAAATLLPGDDSTNRVEAASACTASAVAAVTTSLASVTAPESAPSLLQVEPVAFMSPATYDTQLVAPTPVMVHAPEPATSHQPAASMAVAEGVGNSCIAEVDCDNDGDDDNFGTQVAVNMAADSGARAAASDLAAAVASARPHARRLEHGERGNPTQDGAFDMETQFGVGDLTFLGDGSADASAAPTDVNAPVVTIVVQTAAAASAAASTAASSRALPEMSQRQPKLQPSPPSAAAATVKETPDAKTPAASAVSASAATAATSAEADASASGLVIFSLPQAPAPVADETQFYPECAPAVDAAVGDSVDYSYPVVVGPARRQHTVVATSATDVDAVTTSPTVAALGDNAEPHSLLNSEDEALVAPRASKRLRLSERKLKTNLGNARDIDAPDAVTVSAAPYADASALVLVPAAEQRQKRSRPAAVAAVVEPVNSPLRGRRGDNAPEPTSGAQVAPPSARRSAARKPPSAPVSVPARRSQRLAAAAAIVQQSGRKRKLPAVKVAKVKAAPANPAPASALLALGRGRRAAAHAALESAVPEKSSLSGGRVRGPAAGLRALAETAQAAASPRASGRQRPHSAAPSSAAKFAHSPSAASAAAPASASLGVPKARSASPVVRLCATGFTDAMAEELREVCEPLRAVIVERADEADVLVTPAAAPRTEKLALAACLSPHIVTLAYVRRCAAARCWLPVAATDVPTLEAEKGTLSAQSAPPPLNLAAALRARGSGSASLPARPLSGAYFAFASKFECPANKNKLKQLRRLIDAAGGTLIPGGVSPEFVDLHKGGVHVLADRAVDASDRASRALAGRNVLYDFGLVFTAIMRQGLAPADLAQYRIR